jgi:hypothetical protein
MSANYNATLKKIYFNRGDPKIERCIFFPVERGVNKFGKTCNLIAA